MSAEWACNHNAEQTSCTMHCPQGTKSESVPADSYLCSLDGAWTPSFAPKCVPSKIFFFCLSIMSIINFIYNVNVKNLIFLAVNIIQPPSENLVSGKSYHPIITSKRTFF